MSENFTEETKETVTLYINMAIENIQKKKAELEKIVSFESKVVRGLIENRKCLSNGDKAYLLGVFNEKLDAVYESVTITKEY